MNGRFYLVVSIADDLECESSELQNLEPVDTSNLSQAFMNPIGSKFAAVE